MTTPLDFTDPLAGELVAGNIARSGWLRMRPLLLGLVLREIALAEPPTLVELSRRLAGSDISAEEWLQSSCWDCAGGYPSVHTAAQQAKADRCAEAYGVPPVRTRRDAIDLLAAAGVVEEVPDTGGDGSPRLRLTQPLPAPGEVFPLDEDEAEIQRLVRWHAEHERNSFRVIDMFDPHGERALSIKTTLEQLSRRLDTTPERARQAVLVLLDSGEDFTSSADIAQVDETTEFRLACDWRVFGETRVHVI